MPDIFCSQNSLKRIIKALLMIPMSAIATPPTQNDVDVYSSLCKIGSQSTAVIIGEAEFGSIGRRILGGEAKLSASKLQDEFPGIVDEKNRLLALQSYQDCMYRYVDRFHSPDISSASIQQVIVNPKISSERRREIVFFANEIENFKRKMSSIMALIPPEFYDKRDSTDKKPQNDSRLIGLNDYSGYKAFQSGLGGIDFTNLTNNDLVLLCTTYFNEISNYRNFSEEYRPLNLSNYFASDEAQRICSAAKRGR